MIIYLSISNKASMTDVNLVKKKIEEFLPKAKIVTYHDNNQNFSTLFNNKVPHGMMVFPPKGNTMVWSEENDANTIYVGRGNFDEVDFALDRDVPTLLFYEDTILKVQERREAEKNWQTAFGLLFCDDPLKLSDKEWTKGF